MNQLPSKKNKERFGRAMQALENGEPKKAIELFDKVRKSWRDDPDIAYLEGLAYGKLGDLKGVEKASKRALRLMPNHFGALCNLANAQFTRGEIEAALENYNRALSSKPDAPEIMDNYGRALAMLGRREEAIEFFKKAIQRNSSHAPAHTSLGRAYADAGYPDQAKQEFMQALNLSPDSYEAHIGIGALYAGIGGLFDAEFHYKQAMKIETRNVIAYLGLATIERHKGCYGEALDVLRRAEQFVGRDDPQLLACKADILERRGDKEASYEILNKLAGEDKMSPLAVASFSRLCRNFDRCDEALELIDMSADQASTAISEKQMLMYAAGDLLDKLKRFDDAMGYYNKANSLLGIQCDREGYVREVDDLIKKFNRNTSVQFQRATTASRRPVFVLGMPRSGTTLVEQILATHPDVYGGGELPYMKLAATTISHNSLVRDGDYVHHLADVSQEKMTQVANQYLHNLDEIDTQARFVVDKMPHNFFNVGLISLLFPEARIIHCRRNPLDNALSIYFQSFLWSHDYAMSLADIGFFYKQYDRLMDHWEEVIDIPIMSVQYEDLIEDQEGMSRKLIEFCGLDWDESVLDFHKAKRDVATASYDQVRQPIYKSSMERWRNYEKYLQPLMDELGVLDLNILPNIFTETE